MSALMTKLVKEEEMLREMVFKPERPAGIVATAGWLVMSVGRADCAVAGRACDVMTDGMPVTTPKLLVWVKKDVKPLEYVYVDVTVPVPLLSRTVCLLHVSHSSAVQYSLPGDNLQW